MRYRFSRVRHRVDEALGLVVLSRSRPCFRTAKIETAVVAVVVARPRSLGGLSIGIVLGGRVTRLLIIVLLVALVLLDRRSNHVVKHGSSRQPELATTFGHETHQSLYGLGLLLDRIARVYQVDPDEHYLGREWFVWQACDQAIPKVSDDGCLTVHVEPFSEQPVRMPVELDLSHILVTAEHSMRGESPHGLDLLFDRVHAGQFADVIVQPHPISQVATRKLLSLQPIHVFVGAIE